MLNKKTILVNATALDTGGALSILKQFIEAIPNDEYEYILFVNNKVNIGKTNSNVRLIAKDVKSFTKRFLWDAFGVNDWLKANEIKPTATISLQNTNFRTDKSIPNFIYYHQSVPFFNKKWNPFTKEERPLWFYKNIYPFFVKIFINNNTEVFVQTKCVKEAFAQHFNMPLENIHVITPNFNLPKAIEVQFNKIDCTNLNLFYPATPYIYKNHTTILDALSLLDKTVQQKITIYFTCVKEDLATYWNKTDFQFSVNFMGSISYNEMLGMYKSADALLFPSYIETFGLPLLEGAAFGLPIIASDLPYSREVLIGYEGVNYVAFDDPKLWSEAISKLILQKGLKFPSIENNPSESWNELFKILKND